MNEMPKLTNQLKENKDNSNQDRLGFDRLIFFSDAVFAIAITVLVLDIHLPAGGESFTNDQMLASLFGMWHKFLAYGISFLVVGSFWISHHRKFRLISRYDSELILINLLLLMVIAFIPFPSAVISVNGNRSATIFYALVMILAGILISLLWRHAVRNNLLADPLTGKRQLWRETAAPIVTVLIFLLSIGIAFYNEDLAKIFWLLILPASLIVNKKEPAM
jgi:uncharacterized membrane protein